MLTRWVRGFRGEWYGVVWASISDGAGDVRLTLDDHLVFVAALRPAFAARIRRVALR
jgi:hypothetical protein